MMKRLLFALAAIVSIVGQACAAGPTWNQIDGGFPVWYGAPTFSSNVYTLSAPLPSQPAYTLGNQHSVVIIIPSGGTNTAAPTLNVNSTGALPVVTNTGSGLQVMASGELIAGLEYILQYSTSSASACGSSCYVVQNLPGSAVVAGTTQTVSASQWAVLTVFEVTTASQTLTLPVSSGLNASGGLVVNTVGQSVTLTPNAADAINGGSAGASLTIPANYSVLVTKSSAGNIAVSPGATGVTAGSYTSTNLTVDSFGRLTAASNGSGGSGNYCEAFITAAGTITPSGLGACGTVSGGTWTLPSWISLTTTFVRIEVVGAGGGGGAAGGGGSSNEIGCGGGGGGTAILFGKAVLTASPTFTIGSGGSGGVAGGAAATAGGNTTFVTNSITYTGNGGTLGAVNCGASGAVAGVAGGTATNGTINLPGNASIGITSQAGWNESFGGSPAVPVGVGGQTIGAGTQATGAACNGYGGGGGGGAAGGGSGSSGAAGCAGVIHVILGSMGQ